ncbi:MAG: NUDIX hydrolase [Cellulomonadaceae bacterium]|nr:NUDIX hydrolase [Cellulomonadaceae bacterium]
MRSDTVRMPGGTTAQRDVVELPGAVGIVAMDEADQVLMVRQYRHPVGRRLWEIPAGLLDSTTESALEAGQRELYEEGGLVASSWWTLLDLLTSPGLSDETIRVFLARGLTSADQEFARFDEEAELERRWVPLDEAVASCMAGTIENGITVAGILAAATTLRRGDRLREPDAPWLARKPGAR